jgi:hypothetical protein
MFFQNISGGNIQENFIHQLYLKILLWLYTGVAVWQNLKILKKEILKNLILFYSKQKMMKLV